MARGVGRGGSVCRGVPRGRDGCDRAGVGARAGPGTHGGGVARRRSSGAGDYHYFVAALGGVEALPRGDAELWLAAAASTMSPPEDPGDDVESQAVVGALEHVDWLGLVLGLVRRGVGATPQARDVLEDIDALEDVDGEIDDPEGTIAVLAQAIEVLAPRWQVLGILDDDRGLTRLGRWGLPVALDRDLERERGSGAGPSTRSSELRPWSFSPRRPAGVEELRDGPGQGPTDRRRATSCTGRSSRTSDTWAAAQTAAFADLPSAGRGPGAHPPAGSRGGRARGPRRRCRHRDVRLPGRRRHAAAWRWPAGESVERSTATTCPGRARRLSRQAAGLARALRVQAGGRRGAPLLPRRRR